MKGTRASIFKWIVLLTLSQVSGFAVFQFDDVKNKDVTSNVLKVLKNNEKRDVNALPHSFEEETRYNEKGSTKKYDIKDFRYKKLVKRIVPHGEEVQKLEYDEKFKTLYKPLIRVHKRKPNPGNDNEHKHDLIYVLDDKEIKDAGKLGNDQLLLQPFSTNSAEIQYLEKEVNEADRRNGLNNVDLNYMPNKQNKLILIDNTVKNTREMDYDNDNDIELAKSLRQVLGKHLGNEMRWNSGLAKSNMITQYRKPSVTSNIYKILNRIPLYSATNNQGHKPKKSHRFASVGPLFPKQLTSLYEPVRRGRFQTQNNESSKPKKNYKNKQYINIINLIQALQNKQEKVEPTELYKDRDTPEQPLGWFSPVGAIMSKQFLKEVIPHESSLGQPRIFKNKLRYIQPTGNDFPYSLKMMLLQMDKTNNDRTLDSETEIDNIQALFVRNLNSKQTSLIENKPGIISKTTKLYSLLQDKLSQHDASDFKVTAHPNDPKFKKKYVVKNLKPHFELRTHIKSGEEEEALLEVQKSLFDEETTTRRPVTIMPSYSLWNYWTVRLKHFYI